MNTGKACIGLPFIIVVLIVLLQVSGNAQTTADSAATPPTDTLAPVKKTAAQPVSFDTIAGPLPAVIKAKKNPYLVVGDIEVPVNKSVTVEPGVVFLFKNFTGMHVLGKLTVQGTRESPVIFTTENDRAVNPGTALYPNPYDWNGVYIHADAVGTSMEYCKVRYSVYGIVSETKFIKLDPVLFSFNGKTNLVIEGKEQPVTDKPYSYMLTTTDVGKQGVPVKILADPAAPARNTLRYTGLVVAMAATVGAIYYGTQWNNAQTQLHAMSVDNPSVLRWSNEGDWFSLRDRRTSNMYYTAAGGVIALIGYVGFFWSFTF
ncbi:MAG TPA: hypothetical protein VLX68_11150 [Chitinivibrionales bacterium]|nr:hypothetical protein [Chitinivibrionales bacterium]